MIIRDSASFVESLNAMFARRPEDKLPPPMCNLIVDKFSKWNPQALTHFFEYVCENWANSFSPPNLGQLLKLRAAYNETAPTAPKSNALRLEKSTEGFVGKKKNSKDMVSLGNAMRLKNKGQGKKYFQAEMEKILNERENTN